MKNGRIRSILLAGMAISAMMVWSSDASATKARKGSKKELACNDTLTSDLAACVKMPNHMSPDASQEAKDAAVKECVESAEGAYNKCITLRSIDKLPTDTLQPGAMQSQ